MKTIYTCLLIAIAFLGLTSLSNCKRHNLCDDTPPDYYLHLKIGDSMRSKVPPQTGRDTLGFYNQYGDTVFIKGQGSETFTTPSVDEYTDPNCGYSEHYTFDYRVFYYVQDTALSNTSRVFPIKTIVINADSNDNYSGRSGKLGGLSILTSYWKSMWSFMYLNDEYYKTEVNINNKTYRCNSRNGIRYNHYQGIIQVIENDTIIWNRKF